MNNKVGFSYGVLQKPLKEQAKEQGLELKYADKFEKIREAINMCGFHVATGTQVNAMIKKLNKQVVESLVLLKN